jgi:hypothetical protein
MSYAVRHGGSLSDFNMSKYIDLTGWKAAATTTDVNGTAAVIKTANNLIGASAASATISPFISKPDNNVYVYFLDGNSSADQTYGCLIGSEASYTKSADDLRAIIASGSNYL